MNVYEYKSHFSEIYINNYLPAVFSSLCKLCMFIYLSRLWALILIWHIIKKMTHNSKIEFERAE